jgi:hypothetical protein
MNQIIYIIGLFVVVRYGPGDGRDRRRCRKRGYDRPRQRGERGLGGGVAREVADQPRRSRAPATA